MENPGDVNYHVFAFYEIDNTKKTGIKKKKFLIHRILVIKGPGHEPLVTISI